MRGDPIEAPSAPGSVGTLPALFAHQAGVQPDAILFSISRSHPDLKQRETLETLTYGQAHEMAHRLALTLSDQHLPSSPPPAISSPSIATSDVCPVVGVWIERSIELHLAILATTTAGATWLPFDADAPCSRVAACLIDSRARVLLCDVEHHQRAIEAVSAAQSECRVVLYCDLEYVSRQMRYKSAIRSQKRVPQPHDGAYMIYTSGSSGKPKGIEISHKAALTFAIAEQTVLKTSRDDVVWQGFSAAFDMFIEEV